MAAHIESKALSLKVEIATNICRKSMNIFGKAAFNVSTVEREVSRINVNSREKKLTLVKGPEMARQLLV